MFIKPNKSEDNFVSFVSSSFKTSASLWWNLIFQKGGDDSYEFSVELTLKWKLVLPYEKGSVWSIAKIKREISMKNTTSQTNIIDLAICGDANGSLHLFQLPSPQEEEFLQQNSAMEVDTPQSIPVTTSSNIVSLPTTTEPQITFDNLDDLSNVPTTKTENVHEDNENIKQEKGIWQFTRF